MSTAAAYIRVSTEDQTEFSPDSQLKAVRAYAVSHGFELPEEFIFVDEGISGRRAEKRPAFQKMIGTAKLRPKPFDVILLWKFSRFARNREDSIVYKSMLRKQCGIDVISVSEQLSEDKTSVLIEALIEAMDEYYSLNLAEEVRRGMQEKFSRGGVVSQPPFGYVMSGGKFVPDSVNADIVRSIFSGFISGKGARQIAAELNDMGITTVRGNPFENRAVEYILTNPVYTGKLRRSLHSRNAHDRFHEDSENVQFVDGSHEPLITQEMFDRAQEIRSANKRIFGRNTHFVPSDTMLRGLVRCSACGSALTRQSAAESLQCCGYAKGLCSVSHSVRINKLESLVAERLISDLGGSIIIDVEPAGIPAETVPPAEALLVKERRKLDRVREAYESGVDDLDEYRRKKERITARIAELEEMVHREKNERSAGNSFSGRLTVPVSILADPEVSAAARNTALRSVIDRIVLVRPGNTVEVYYK